MSGPIIFLKIVKIIAIIPKFHFFKKKKIIENLLQSKKTTTNINIRLWLSATEITEKVKS